MSHLQFHRRQHLAQLGAGTAALVCVVPPLLTLSSGEAKSAVAIEKLFAKLTTGRTSGSGLNNAWCIIETGAPEKSICAGAGATDR